MDQHPFLRSAREFDLDIILPTMERVYNKKTFFGDKLKHVIEPRVTYKYISGLGDYSKVIRYDQVDLLNDTNQVELSVTNRILRETRQRRLRDLHLANCPGAVFRPDLRRRARRRPAQRRIEPPGGSSTLIRFSSGLATIHPSFPPCEHRFGTG